MIGSHDAATWPTFIAVAVSDPDLLCFFFDKLGDGDTGVNLWNKYDSKQYKYIKQFSVCAFGFFIQVVSHLIMVRPIPILL